MWRPPGIEGNMGVVGNAVPGAEPQPEALMTGALLN